MAKKKSGKSNNAHLDWIASLARDNASSNDAKIPSKEDRKRKREMKKNRRIEQKRQKELQQQQQQRRPRQISTQDAEYPSSQAAKTHRKGNPSSSLALQRQSRSILLLKLSKPRLRRLSQNVQAIRKDTKERPQPYYDLPYKGDEKGSRTSHYVMASKKRKRGKWSEESIQPLRSDYSGIGLARMSMYIQFVDPSYFPKLEEEFKEHIPGFFGKQRTKAMKKQIDGNMLWRRLADEKKKNGNTKKFKNMSADERVQAMIDATDRSALLG